jgi:ABC-type nitrate/sulfonate/bicarbonate transport system substrate-binding protein
MPAVMRLWAAAALVVGIGFHPGPVAAKTDPLPIRIAFSPSGYTRLYTAMALDLFSKHGLKAEFISFQSGAAGAAAFKSGSIDIGSTAVPGFASGRLNGSDVQVFAIEADDSATVSLIARSQSGIASVRDLAGKKVGTAVGTVGYLGLVFALAREGMTPTSAQISNLQALTWVPIFKAGEMDAIFAYQPQTYQLMALGGKRIASLKEFTPDPIMWVGRSAFLNSPQGSEAAARFLAAMDEGGRLYKENALQVIKYMAERNGITIDVATSLVNDLIEIPYSEQVGPTGSWSLTNPNSLKAVYDKDVDTLVRLGILPSAPSFEGAVNPKPLKALFARQK